VIPNGGSDNRPAECAQHGCAQVRFFPTRKPCVAHLMKPARPTMRESRGLSFLAPISSFGVATLQDRIPCPF
jgi:hypothetical protein